jgi:hypothetical protein
VIDERRQTVLLTRTFFSRQFESDLMPSGLPQIHLVVWVVAFLAGLSTVLPILMARRYVWLLASPGVLKAAMSADRNFMTLLMMIATGLITLVIWEGLFPDARDARILGVIPIRARTFVVSRLAALMFLFVILVMTTTFASSVMTGVLSAMFKPEVGFVRAAVSSFATSAGAEAVVFFGIIALQCALLNIAGAAVAQRLAVALQIALVVMLLQMPLLLARLTGSGIPAGAPLAALATSLSALVLYAATYRRLTRLALEGTGRLHQRTGSLRGLVGSASRLTTWSQPACAVCAFTLRTAARSRQHRMILAGWIGLALAIILASLVPLLFREGLSGLAHPRTSILAAPLVLSTLTLAGMRMLFAIPTMVKANWVVRTCQAIPVRRALDGATAALIVCVIPATALAAVSATALWGAGVGAVHAVICFVTGVLLSQALTLGLDKLPFTCTYMPGKAKFIHLWPLYVTAFTTFTFTLASLEVEVLQRGGAAWLIGVLAVVAGVLASIRHARARAVMALRFEEEEDDAITLLPISGSA